MTTDRLSKIEREYNEIKTNSSLPARERINALLAIETEKRPNGAIVAEKQSWLRSELQSRRNRARCEATVRVYEGYTSRTEQRPIEQQFCNSAARLARRNRKLEQMGAQWCKEIYAARDYAADRKNGWLARLFNATPQARRGVNEISSHSGVARVNGWLIKCLENETVDWNAYSKAWHRAHGPKRTIENRRVVARRVNERDQVEERVYYVDGWRGNYALNAVIAMGLVEAVKVPVKLRPVQLHEAYAVREIRKIAGVTIYERTLAGEHYDYCALWHGLTYHAATMRACVTGLRTKFAEVERKKNATIDFNFCRSLGFCDAGIKQFARDFNLDIKGSYTADEIAEAVKGDLSTASKFVTELKKLADVIGYSTAQFAI